MVAEPTTPFVLFWCLPRKRATQGKTIVVKVEGEEEKKGYAFIIETIQRRMEGKDANKIPDAERAGKTESPKRRVGTSISATPSYKTETTIQFCSKQGKVSRQRCLKHK